MRNEDLLVYVIWIAAGGLAFVLIPGALIRGLRRNSNFSLVYWRERTLIATILSCVSLFLFLLSFDQLVRGSLQAESKGYLDDRFYELKLITGLERATSCARDDDTSKKLCGAWENIDKGYRIDDLRQGHELQPISDWQANGLISHDLRDRVARLVVLINQTIPAAATHSLLRPETRLSLAMLAAVLLIFAVAGSVGEAAFQLTQAQVQAEAQAKTPPQQENQSPLVASKDLAVVHPSGSSTNAQTST
jgi:hypothetical protein